MRRRRTLSAPDVVDKPRALKLVISDDSRPRFELRHSGSGPSESWTGSLSSQSKALARRALEDAVGQKSLSEHAHAFVHGSNTHAQGRATLSEETNDPARENIRLGTSGLVSSHRLEGPGARHSIGVALARRHLTTSLGELGAKVAGLEQGHTDAEGAQLTGQCLRVALERELARAVVRLERQADDAANGADDDHASATLAQMWQGGPHRAIDAEEVGLELRASLLGRRVLHGTGQPPARRGDQGVEASLA